MKKGLGKLYKQFRPRVQQYVFRVTSEVGTRTESVRAASLTAAEAMMHEINPRCTIKFLWRQD